MSLDIEPVDTEKWYFRIAMNWFIKKYSGGKNSRLIHEEMMNCGNPIIHYFLNLKDDVVSNISEREKWQRSNIDNIAEFFLWILYKDTAYRQIFFWSLKKLMDDKKILLPDINKYYNKPEEWFVNIYSEAKNLTDNKRNTGEIPKTNLSHAESFFVPRLTGEKIGAELMLKELEKERKKTGV